MPYRETEEKEIVLVRYYNVLFYIFFRVAADEFKKQLLTERIDSGEQFNMKGIYSWCRCQQVPVKMKFTYRRDFLLRANLWNLYSYYRFRIDIHKVYNKGTCLK